MTVTGTTSRNNYAGSGIAGPFPYAFRIFAATDLEVIERDPDGLEVSLAYPADFTLTGIGDRNGGNLTLTYDLPADYTLSIRRVRPMTQGFDLRNQGPYFPEIVEDGLDDRAMVDQQQQDELGRSLKLHTAYDPEDFDMYLPAPAPGKALVWNGAGTGFDNATLTEDLLTQFAAAENKQLDVFVSGTDFTAGVTTALTLALDPGSLNNLVVVRRTLGAQVWVMHDGFTVDGTTLTFGAVIPADTTRIEVMYTRTHLLNRAFAENVRYVPVTDPATDVRTRLREHDAQLDGLFGIYTSVKSYGAVGDGVADDTTAIQDAIDDLVAEGGGVLFFPSGTYLVSANIDCDRTVQLRGSSARTSILKAASAEKIIDITGGINTWDHDICGLTFDKVRLRYGFTTSDYGNGSGVRNCMFRNCTIGIEYIHRSWITLIHNCKIFDCDTGVKFSFATAVNTAGARMCISHSAIFGITNYGVHIDGNTSDGHDIKILCTQFEHCGDATAGAAIYSRTTEGTTHITDCHFENNEAITLDLEGDTIFLRGMWAFLDGLTHDVFCKLGNSARLYLRESRFQWQSGEPWGKLVRLVHASARLIIDPDTIFSANAFFGKEAAAMAATGSTAGKILQGGPGFAFSGKLRGGKVYTGQHAMGYSTAVVTPDVHSVAVASIYPFEGSTRVYEFDLRLESAGAGLLRIALEDGTTSAFLTWDFTTTVGANPVGRGRMRIVNEPGVSLSISGAWTNDADNKTVFVWGNVTDTTDQTLKRFLSIQSTDPANSPTPMLIENFFEYVH